MTHHTPDRTLEQGGVEMAFEVKFIDGYIVQRLGKRPLGLGPEVLPEGQATPDLVLPHP